MVFRGSGRTTARVLQGIADALLQPDEWVCVVDHAGNSEPADFADVVRCLVDLLPVTIDVELRGRWVFLRSPISRLRKEAVPE